MTGYNLVSLKEMVEQIGEEKTKTFLSDFYCPQNPDVEKFIRYKALEFSKQNIAPTHLVFTSYKEEIRLIGYFTLTIKNFYVAKNKLSKTLAKRISKFGTYDENIKGYSIPAPLIAQLGKNFKDNLNTLITGDELLKLACDKIKSIQSDIGGKITYLECEDKSKLTDFYESNSFVRFGNRPLDKDEKDDLSGDYLVQMLKYLN
ncbi:hypothetical protein [Clostridium butyricum]|uniref:N-acetyltransferase n=1 Tax=Clostridium butyricum TaxID=1492 RepID=A0AAP9RGG5_CLOBU|nr:hypothetical protein [Clostridium butyricum]MBZ5747015.1 N-acetyltransferase [Clostridium butyricum]MDI9207894.1 N-acetyltransferase [Clostridium butyricum]QMW91907.1 N-acetyltransferase [Clostridium butyricum]BBK75862.1 hypothetical protein Cbu04g_08700 [Clostridium butyricum]